MKAERITARMLQFDEENEEEESDEEVLSSSDMKVAKHGARRVIPNKKRQSKRVSHISP